jgi:HEAT repeat protein
MKCHRIKLHRWLRVERKMISIREHYLSNALLIVMLALSQLGLAQGSQEPKSRDLLIKESIANLDSDNIYVAAQAARDLGYARAVEAVPAMLRVLQSSRLLSRWEHIMPKDKDGMSEYVITDVKGEIINSLGLIGDWRAVPVLKKYLKKPPKNSVVFTGNVAYALDRITGKSYKYKDRDGKMKLFQKPVS